MRAPNRLIITAARPDRPSFGCQADRTYTVFDECLLSVLPQASTWRRVYDADLACVRQRERELGVLPSQPQGFFGICSVVPRRVQLCVADAVVHGREAGGSCVGEIGYLYGRGLACEDGQAVVIRVPGQVDENIDRVVADAARAGFVVDPRDVVPRAESRFKALRDGVVPPTATTCVDVAGQLAGSPLSPDAEMNVTPPWSPYPPICPAGVER